MKIIKKYKGVSLKYNEINGKIVFGFEGIERIVKYVFEAEQIIDEPMWENCNLEGYFIDGYTDKYIGLAKATRKDTKSGNPDWNIKGRYDIRFKNWNDDKIIYPKNIMNDDLYKKWQEQRFVYNNELRKLNQITSLLDI